MAKQKTTNIVGRLITKVKSILTQVNKNTAAIKALPTGGGSTPTWKDISSSYKTRVWTEDDFGKEVRVEWPAGNTEVIGYISKVWDPAANGYSIGLFAIYDRRDDNDAKVKLFYIASKLNTDRLNTYTYDGTKLNGGTYITKVMIKE